MSERLDDFQQGANAGSYVANPRAPRDDNTYPESTGHITKDSLAAESMRDSDSGFASNPEHAGQGHSSVPSKSTTANTTDTSGAVRLNPDARDSSNNDASAGSGDAEALYSSGSRRFDTESYSTPGDERRQRERNEEALGGGSGDGVYDTTRGGPQTSYGGDAPRATYAESAGGNGNGTSRGGVTEVGGFPEDAPNASLGAGADVVEPGSRRDPGRVAEQRMERDNATAGADAGYEGVNSTGRGERDQGGFENLQRDESA